MITVNKLMDYLGEYPPTFMLKAAQMGYKKPRRLPIGPDGSQGTAKDFETALAELSAAGLPIMRTRKNG